MKNEKFEFNAWPPALIIYQSDVPRLTGVAKGPVVYMKTAKSENPALLAHELEHVRQWWRLPIIHNILMLVSSKYKLRSEIQAYRIQIEKRVESHNLTLAADIEYYRTEYAKRYAGFLDEKYDIPVSYEQALNLLLDHHK